MVEGGEFINRGYKVINFCDNYFYYVLGENAGYTYPTAEKIKEEWYPEKFSSNQPDPTPEQMKAVIGTSFAIWSDRPDAQTMEEVFAGIKGPLKAMVEKL
jgi:hexosaminidase